MADMEKKRGSQKYKNLNISKTKRAIIIGGQSFGEKEKFDKR